MYTLCNAGLFETVGSGSVLIIHGSCFACGLFFLIRDAAQIVKEEKQEWIMISCHWNYMNSIRVKLL